MIELDALHNKKTQVHPLECLTIWTFKIAPRGEFPHPLWTGFPVISHFLGLMDGLLRNLYTKLPLGLFFWLEGTSLPVSSFRHVPHRQVEDSLSDFRDSLGVKKVRCLSITIDEFWWPPSKDNFCLTWCFPFYHGIHHPFFTTMWGRLCYCCRTTQRWSKSF